jgi:hypothetical protein
MTPWSLLSAVLLIGICCLGLFLFSYKIARLFLNPYTSFLVSLFPILLLRFINQWWPETEFFSSGFILLSIYAVCKLFMDNLQLTQRQQCFWGGISGLSFAIVFWMKYQLVGLWIGLIFTLILLLVLRKITVKKFFSLFLSHLTGFCIPTVGILIYFGIHGAIGDLFYCYFFSRYNFGSSIESSAPIDNASSLSETTSAIVTESPLASLAKLSLYIYIVEFAILGIFTLIALLAHRSFNFSLKLFIFSGVICSFILASFVIWLNDLAAGFTPRNLTAVICFTIFALIYWVHLITQKLKYSAFLKIPKPLTSGLYLILLGMIYWSGLFGIVPSSVQYIWDAKTTATRLSNPVIEQWRDGPYYYEQMADWLKKHYPNQIFSAWDPGVQVMNFELHEPSIVKYSFCPPNREICSLHFQEVHDKITNGEINLLTTNVAIIDTNQIISLELMYEQLQHVYGENSDYRVSTTILTDFTPVLAINQMNESPRIYVLWIKDSTV